MLSKQAWNYPSALYSIDIVIIPESLSLRCTSLEDIETFERPASSAASSDERMAVGRQLEKEREARHSHRERLHNLNTWQFRSLIKDVIQQEDFEIKDGARSRAMSGDRPIAVSRDSLNPAIGRISDEGILQIGLHCRNGRRSNERT